jgi:hypothetical protein
MIARHPRNRQPVRGAGANWIPTTLWKSSAGVEYACLLLYGDPAADDLVQYATA